MLGALASAHIGRGGGGGEYLHVPLCVIQCGNRSRLYPVASTVRVLSDASMPTAAAAEGMLGGVRGCRTVGADEARESVARSVSAESFMVCN